MRWRGFRELRPTLAEVGGVGLEPLSMLTGVGRWGCTDFLIYEIDKIRLFVVDLLEDVNDHQVANQINDILLSKSD